MATVEPKPTALDQEHLTVNEEDQSQNEQQQQKEVEEENAEEASNGAAAVVVEVNGSGEANNNEEEEEEEEDLSSLLKPFTKEQLHGIVEQVAKKASNFFYGYSGVKENLDLQDERLEKYLESSSRRTLHDFLIIAEYDLPTKSLICQVANQMADVNPPHLKILVQSHGFRWNATDETLSSVFSKYGEITEIEICNNVTDKIIGYAFISFKHWNGARKALKQPLKKIGNRWTMCKLAINDRQLKWLEPAQNSEKWAKNIMEEFQKVVDCPILQFSGLDLVREHPWLTSPRYQSEHIPYYESLVRNLHQWLHGEPVNRARPPIPITYCDPAAMNYGTSGGCNRDTSIL